MVAQIRKMMEGQNNNVTYCLSKADADKGFEEMFKKGREGDCTYERFDATSDSIDAIMVCKGGPQGGSARMTMNGSVGKTGSKVNVNVAQKNEGAPMGNADIAMELTTTRLGDCPRAREAEPGRGAASRVAEQGDRGDRVADAELGQRVGAVDLDRARADPELAADLLVGPRRRHQPDHFALARR
jgi:hypothetical protein